MFVPILKLSRGFFSSTEVLGKEAFGSSIEFAAIFRADKTVTFIWEHQVFDRQVILPHGLDDLVAFGLFNAWIIGALSDEEGALDAVGLKEGRTFFKELLFVLQVSYPLVKEALGWIPVGWDCLEIGDKIRDPY